ncbi:transketolase family protein [bacterium]|nr:transketolase family protein [bacterium]
MESIIKSLGNKGKIATRDVYGTTLAELGKIHEEIVVLDADLSGSTRTAVFAEAFPHRFFNMGIAEQDMIGTAAGFAACGKIPFASTFAIFETGRAWEQIRQSICFTRLPVRLVASHGGITVGEDGASHHALEDIALMRILPNISVVVPADGIEMKKAIYTSLSHPGPVYIRSSREKFPIIHDEDYEFEFGKAHILLEGSDVTIMAIGLMVWIAYEAAELLKKEGVSARLINMSSVKPLDVDCIINAAKETRGIVTAEEHLVNGGFGSAISEVVSEFHPTLVKKIGVYDCFGVSGKPDILLEKFGLTKEAIFNAAMSIIKKP